MRVFLMVKKFQKQNTKCYKNEHGETNEKHTLQISGVWLKQLYISNPSSGSKCFKPFTNLAYHTPHLPSLPSPSSNLLYLYLYLSFYLSISQIKSISKMHCKGSVPIFALEFQVQGYSAGVPQPQQSLKQVCLLIKCLGVFSVFSNLDWTRNKNEPKQ